MAPLDTAGQQPRPTMRRKSSAQNLLNTFKSNSNAASVPGPPTGTALTMQIPSGALNSGMSGGGVSTPTSTTPMSREWDSQSMHSDSVASTSGPLNANGSPALPQGTSVEYLRDLVMKRMITLSYMRNVHDGYVSFIYVV